MKQVLVIYATRTGHTGRIAEHIADRLRADGLSVELTDAAHLPAELSLDNYSAVIAAASVRLGKHESEMIRFAQRNATGLNRLPSAFISVSLSEAGVEDLAAAAERRAQASADVERMIDKFVQQTGWHPQRVKAVAGALSYTRYNSLVRFAMKRIAAKAGASTDASKDHSYTDWNALDRLVDEFARTAVAAVSA